MLRDEGLNRHFHHAAFHGHDFDNTMLRIGSMNMLLHGVENPQIAYRDSLAQEHADDAGRYSLVLANPPFAGSLDYETTAKDLLQIVKTKMTELLFLALFLPELTDDMLARAVVSKGGRPRSASPRQLISLRLPAEVIARWRATGPGWQTRMAERLSRAPAQRMKTPR